ncbi:SDR family oxidoreductase [Streptomyces xiamenensis]|uniref:SDR family oxidoreductase n=1 Tax=Streptomyces xiamenensis TaxID=408015 RepID=UPI0037D5D09F
MIVVTGATGSIGRELVRRLDEAEVPFRALVRDEARGEALGCPYVVGDFDRPETLEAAFAGADRLLLNSAGAIPLAEGEGPQPMIRQQNDAIDVARAAGISRVVKISVLRPAEGAGLSVGAHWEIERHLKASGLEWTILQPSAFLQNMVTGDGGMAAEGRIAGPYGAGRVAYIDAYDIAASAAVPLTGEVGAGRTYVLTGPEALTHGEIAERLGITYHDVPPAQAAAGLRANGLPERFVAELLALWADMAAGGLADLTEDVQELTGRRPRTLEEFLRAHPHVSKLISTFEAGGEAGRVGTSSAQARTDLARWTTPSSAAPGSGANP